MKSTLKYIFLIPVLLLATSCEKDNYAEPEAGIFGQVYDHHGNPLQVAIGQGSMSIRIVERSFAQGDTSKVVTPQYLNLHQDGSFINNKLFAGVYEANPHQGPFYEALDEDQAPYTEIVDLSNGKRSQVNFTVTPFLTLEWVKEPFIATDGKIYASFKFHRNKKAGYEMPDLNDCCIWISRTQYCGPEGDGNYTPATTKLTPDMEDQEILLSSKIAIKYANHYWIRIGARCNDIYQKYIFTDIKELDVTENQVY